MSSPTEQPTDPAAAYFLVRLSPAHPLWHLQQASQQWTMCGRVPSDNPVVILPAEPHDGPTCTTCGPRIAALLDELAAHPPTDGTDI